MDASTTISALVIALFLANVAALVWVAMAALKIYKGPVTAAIERVKPMIAQGKEIAEVSKEKVAGNQTRLQALTGEFKGIYEKVRPVEAGPQPAINFKTIMTAFSVLSALRRGFSQMKAAKKPTANPPGPAAAKKRSLPKRMGYLSMAPDILRFVLDVKRTLRGA